MFPVLCLLSACQANPAATPKPRGEAWLAQHESYVKEAKEGGIDLLFLGDSITEGWRSTGKKAWNEVFAPLKAASFGITSDGTHHLLWRIQNGELEGIQPKVVVLLIGVNNLAVGHGSEATHGGIQAILSEIQKRSPRSRVLLLGVFPCRSKEDPLRKKAIELNERIKGLGDGKRVQFLDIGERFLEPDGSIPKSVMSDGLHLTAEGYRRWAEAVRAPIQKMMQSP